MARLPNVGDQFGRYRIDSQIGRGGMGVVFAATDTSFDRRVALKVLSVALGDSEEFQRRFEREAALLARLNSPHVIDIYDYGVQDDCPYIATQYVGGGDVGGLMAARGAMPPQLAARVCAQVADALHDAHRTGVVHRDVKPTNVLLRDADTLDLHAYLCDFGIARTDSDGLTQPGSVTGTWSYLSPECGKGAPGSPASDVYALGCLFWATLTGAPPFRGTDVEIAVAHQQAPVPQLAGNDPFTRQANDILRATMAKDPRDRYPDADQLRTALLAAAGTPSSGIRPVLPPPGPRGSSPSLPPMGYAPPGSTPPPAGPPSGPPAGPHATPSGRYPASGGSPAYAPPARRSRGLVVGGVAAAVLLIAGAAVAVVALDPFGGSEREDGPVVGSQGWITGDIDDDGLGDLGLTEVFRTPDPLDFVTLRSDGSSFSEPDVQPLFPDEDTSRNFILGDFDGDGVGERLAAVGENGAGEVVVSGEMSGVGEVESDALEVPVELGEDRFLFFGSGDLDGDGRDDLMWSIVNYEQAEGQRVTSSVEVWASFSDGEGNFAAAEQLTTIERGSKQEFMQIEIGDVDGDGRDDVAVMQSRLDFDEDTSMLLQTAEVSVHLNTEDGFEEQEQTQPVEGVNPDLVLGDFDGDGDAELALPSGDDENVRTVKVVDWDGEALAEPVTWGLLNPGTTNPSNTSIGVGDFDGDGLDDLANVDQLDRRGRTVVYVLLSDGEGFANPEVWARWTVEDPPKFGAGRSATPPLILGSVNP